jgi:hypothetical protein
MAITPAYAALGFREWDHDASPRWFDNHYASQKLAVRLLEWACGVGPGPGGIVTNGAHAVNEFNPRYKLVTEGRDWRAGKPDPDYSSCGDLGHWLHYRMGVRDTRVNRAELWVPPYAGDGGPRRTLKPNYKPGANVSRLTQWLSPVAPNVHTTLMCTPGDILIVRGAPGTEHVICVIDHHIENEFPEHGSWVDKHVLMTAEYGQPGGALRTRDVELRQDRDDCGRACACPPYGEGLYIGQRRILYRIPLLDVLAQARAAGRLVAAESPE